jgi:signal transduction histidine kinase
MIFYWIGAAFDVEDLKRAEDELRKSEERFRAIISQATRAKDEFLAVVSHELRSPLNAILGWNR